MRPWALLLVVPCLVLAPGLESAFAIDHPLSSGKLDVKRYNGKDQLTFSSRDPAFLFPALGSADDPGTGSPGGALIEILSAVEPTVSFTVPAGTGKPGWVSKPGNVAKHLYSNTASPSGPSPIKKMHLRQGKVLALTSKLAGLGMSMPTTRVAVRITTGTQRNCIVFAGPSISKNEFGRLKAQKKDATIPPHISDCTDASLLGGSNTCGNTSPTCDGECPPDEECASYGSPGLNTCGCLPIGSTPCGNPGVPECGGICPNDENCGSIFTPFGAGCMCGVPDCGNGFYYGGAPQEGVPFGCYPILCGSDYPTCSADPCGGGGTCSPFEAGAGSFAGCIYATPMPCNAGGYECPVGEVCRINGPNPGCGPP
ncbi:MAG: hypothetical protein ABIR79_11055 [Candidatus Binatia bacterium]